jgi:regulator of cell morphogenesis and NO signaling
MQLQSPPTVSELVRADYRLADVFKKWGINYCCGGSLALEEACRVQGLNQTALEDEMKQACETVRLSNALNAEDWPVDFLVDYLVHVHHAYIKKTGATLLQTFEHYTAGHQKKYPYLMEVYALFETLMTTVVAHVQQEEDVMFPYIRQVANALKRKESYGPLFVRTMRQSLNKNALKSQQETVQQLTQLRAAATQYRFPEGACTNHQVYYHKLQEFDADLVLHKHLENNILFPKVAQMEAELLQL